MSSSTLRAFSTILLCLTSLAATTRAQLPPNSSTTATPIPGAGHDYLNGFDETVNSSTGSLSVRVPVIMPPGRGITLPFSFAYDSSGVNFLSGDATRGVSMGWFSTNSVISQGGWSNTAPLISVTALNWQTHLDPVGHVDCKATINYVYQDPRGVRHNLGLTTYSDPSFTGVCSTNTGDWPRGFDGVIVTTGGEGSILASVPSDSTPPGAGPVSVTDADGNSSGFNSHNQLTTWLAGAGAVSTWLAAVVGDRNGNGITISGTSPAFNYVDTLGRTVLQDSGFAVSPETVTILGLGAPYTLNWTTIATPSFTTPETSPVITGPGIVACGNPAHASWGTYNHVVSSLTLPNGKSFTFAYDTTYGLVNKITYPTGGYVRYVWGMNPNAEYWQFDSSNGTSCNMYYGVPAVFDRYVSYDGITEVQHQHFAYSTTWGTNPASQWTRKQTIVTTSDILRNTSFQTTYIYSPVFAVMPPNMSSGLPSQIPVESSVAYYNDLGTTLLKTVSKGWFNERMLEYEQTTYPNGGPSSLTVYCYNSSELETEHDEYDFGTSPSTLPSCAQGMPSGIVSGSILRKTTTTYATFTGHIVDRPATAITYDGNNNRVAETDYPSYDTNGNLLTQTKQCFALPGGQACPQGNSTTTYTYDSHGQRLTMKDPNGNTTSYSYADSYSSCSGHAPPSSPSDAYLTQVTFPQTGSVNHIVSYCYDYTSGLKLSSTDQNNQVTTYTYNAPPTGCSFPDGLNRLSSVTYPDQGKTTYCYNDASFNASTPSPSVTTTKAITSSTSLTTLAAFDGLGHTVRNVLTSDPDCATGDRTDTTYDGLGRVYTVSNPYCSTTDPTYGLTTYAYDALGRTTQVTHPDNSTVLTTYTGRATQVQDEGNGTQRVGRVSQVDGLGRLVSVCEAAPGPFVGAGGASTSSLIGSSGAPITSLQDIPCTGFITAYQYDILGNLLQVSQSGIAARTFTYDSLSRLLSASNPESGSMSYTYDANGNVLTKTAPAPNQTGTATVTTCFGNWSGTSCGSTGYDTLNRLLEKSYSDGTTPTLTFAYDSSCNSNYLNAVGRLSYSSVTGWSFCYGYDVMGRVTDKDLSMASPSGRNYIDYTYDLMGNILTGTAGYGAASNTYNTAARLTSVTSNYSDANNPQTIVSGMHYNAFGALTSDTLGNNEAETWTYNKRGWPQSYTAMLSTTQIYSYNISSFAPNGDILAVNDSANGNWNYSYDQFNRLVCANLATNGICATPPTGTPTYTYVYDRFGNRWQQNGSHSFVASFTGNNTTNNNRMDGYSYDAAGNLLNDGLYTYTYDAENRIINLHNLPGNGGALIATYAYDPDGNRVEKITTIGGSGDPAGTWQFLYDLSGHMIQRFNGTLWQGNIYAGSRHLAEDGGGTNFSHSDWLGTERVRTSYSSGLCETISSLPFGDGQTTTGACYHSSPLHFTGKFRDSESGLDNFGARYNSSSMGRFMSPDSTVYVKPINPQSWNLYAYTRNNPLLFVDPSGNTVSLANCQDITRCVRVLTNAAQLPKGVTAEVDKNGNLVLKGDLSQIKGGNALRLMQLVNSDKTANFWIGDKAPGLDRGQTQDVHGGLSGTTSQGYNQNFSVVQSDPSKVDSGDLSGVFLNPDGSTTAGQIPGTDIEEAAAHELLGHVWADLVGGQSAGTDGNLREALIAEDRVRNTDPSQGLKIRHQDSGQLIRTTDLPRITNPGDKP